MPAMTDVHSDSLRPSPNPDLHPRPQWDETDTRTTLLRSVVPTNYHDLSPLDALAAQGRLLNKRLIQKGSRKSSGKERRFYV